MINRENKMNALNIETMQEIKLVFQHIYDTASIKGVIITGKGLKSFVAGADIEEIAKLNPVNGRKFSENGQEVFDIIENCPKPVIAAVNGFALGGGCELAMACHLRIASENAKFGQPEVNLGIIPGYGGTQRLVQLAGKGKALEIMMTGEIINVQEAHRIGLVNHITTFENLLFACQELLKKILAKSPMAVAKAVECVVAHYSHDKNGYQVEANLFGNCCGTEDFTEGTAAFLEKRKPKFGGE